MEFPWDGQQWKEIRLKISKECREINKEIPPTRSEIVKEFPWDRLKFKKVVEIPQVWLKIH